MKDKSHKAGIHENYLVNRRLNIEGLDKALIDPLVAQLNLLAEVDEVSILMHRERIVMNIDYDASVRSDPLEDINQALAEIGARIADDWWTRFKQRYYRVTDQNIYDNARHEPSRCSKTPSGK